MACNPDKIIAALHEERENVTDIVHTKINLSDRTVLRKIKDGGVIPRTKNSESIVYGEARQASKSYREVNFDPKPLVEGEMTGRKLTGRNGLFDTDINDIDDNACHGFCTIQFGQGFRRRGYRDFEMDVDTPVKCARELDRLGRTHIEGYFEGFRRQFTQFGMDNFSDNLLNLVIEQGEANASVTGANEFEVTRGGWKSPPKFALSIPFLEDYRLHVMSEMKFLGLEVPENWKLEIELPRRDWFDMVYDDQLIRYNGTIPGGVQAISSMDIGILKNPEDALRGREYHDYGNFRAVFNEAPIRGVFRQTGVDTDGNPVHEFVRIYDWKNERGGEAGLVVVPNPDYHEASIEIGGVRYDVVTLIPHIHPESFRRHAFEAVIKPMGDSPLGLNYDVKVIDGAYIPNNLQNDKFKLIARHEFRFVSKYPEVSGMIAYRHSVRPGYVREPHARILTPGTTAFAGTQNFDNCGIEEKALDCALCGEVSDASGDCEPAGDLPASAFRLSPAGNIETIYDGEESTVTLEVLRVGNVNQASVVTYATATGGANGSATAGTHFTAASGTLNWAAGDTAPKTITIPILDGSGIIGDDVDFTLNLTAGSKATLIAGAGTARIAIVDATGVEPEPEPEPSGPEEG